MERFTWVSRFVVNSRKKYFRMYLLSIESLIELKSVEFTTMSESAFQQDQK